MAVITATGQLQLYGMRPGRPIAHLLRQLDGPVGGKASYVTLSGGGTPRVCATWQINNAENTLYCYDWPAANGYQIPTKGEDLDRPVGLSFSGDALAWTGRRHSDIVPTLFVQSKTGTVTAIPGETTRPAGYEATANVSDIAWQGEETVLLSWAVDDGVNGAIGVVPVSTPPDKGWKDAPVIGLTDQRWPVVQGLASSTENSLALAIVWDAGSSMQAVRLDLTKKGISTLIAFPASHRRMSSVSGGPGGVLYRTESDQDRRTYWRAPGRPYGSPVVGLPADAWSVVAQP